MNDMRKWRSSAGKAWPLRRCISHHDSTEPPGQPLNRHNQMSALRVGIVRLQRGSLRLQLPRECLVALFRGLVRGVLDAEKDRYQQDNNQREPQRQLLLKQSRQTRAAPRVVEVEHTQPSTVTAARGTAEPHARATQLSRPACGRLRNQDRVFPQILTWRLTRGAGQSRGSGLVQPLLSCALGFGLLQRVAARPGDDRVDFRTE